MEYPSDRRYTKEHEWVKVDNGIGTVGITSFAQQELGEVVFVDLPSAGKSVKQSESVCVVESTKAASDVYSPVDGTVKESNKALLEKPDLINNSPYDQGWLTRLANPNMSQYEKLMDAQAYQAFLGEKA